MQWYCAVLMVVWMMQRESYVDSGKLSSHPPEQGSAGRHCGVTVDIHALTPLNVIVRYKTKVWVEQIHRVLL